MTDADEVRLHRVIRGPGDGRRVLLLHGGGSSARTWNGFTDLLIRHGFRTLALDLRGHGASDRRDDYSLEAFRRDVSVLLDQLGWSDGSIVGHSLGAHIAIGLAEDRPHRWDRLVLEEPPAPPPGGTAAPRRVILQDLQMVLTGLRHRAFDARAVRSVVSELRRPDPGWWDALRTITASTLVVGGGNASHLDQSTLQAIAAQIPDSSQVEIPVGHRVHSRDEHRYGDVVLEFLH